MHMTRCSQMASCVMPCIGTISKHNFVPSALMVTVLVIATCSNCIPIGSALNMVFQTKEGNWMQACVVSCVNKGSLHAEGGKCWLQLES